ncbi:Ribonuclease h-like superfamily protein [Thalictrum thalictroides]|uniref:Ribonuclease h-like superfamily protein n=1 Tax=Thalictrum thalictroides TaxID=46969 RepID=A0A7J6VR83_THATH|nr:Ribonuclease h-like superfamily protein [Thalictrum thalictroides]
MGMVEKRKVCDVIDRNAQQWDIQLLKEMVPEPVVNSILQIPLRHNSLEDSVKWNGTTNGAFSVKSAYALAMVEESSSSSRQELDMCFKQLWKLRIPASLQLFIWRVFNLALPVGEVLDKHHVIGDLACIWCNESNETHDHVFFTCEWVKRVWFFSPVNMVVQDRDGWTWGQCVPTVCTAMNDVVSDINIGWKAPVPYGFIKLNFNGVFDRYTSGVSAGVIYP